MTIADARTLESLRNAFSGGLFEPGEGSFAEATSAYNTTVVQRPALVALPETVEDVQLVVAYAKEQGLQVAAQRSGHNAAPLGSLDGVVLVRTDRLRSVAIDAERRIARVESGAKWEDVVPLASEHGLAASHGSSPDVSVVGYTLGGGVGWYARKHGLACNNVSAIELVTADGAFRRVDHESDADLFWALRGGGGNFGVVTAVEIELFPIDSVYAGVLFFPFERAQEVLEAWRQWTTTVPDDVTSVGRLLQFPPIPDVPEPLRGNSFAILEAVIVADEQAGSDLLAPLRALGPVMDTFAVVPPAGIAELHMDPPDPVPYVGSGQLLGSFDASTIDAFVAAAGPGSGSPLVSVEIRHCGGALSRATPAHGALATLEAEYITFAVGMAIDEQMAGMMRAQIEKIETALAPYDNGRSYLNFCESPTPAERFFGDAYPRLRAIRSDVDPTGLFRANHPIGAGAPTGG